MTHTDIHLVFNIVSNHDVNIQSIFGMSIIVYNMKAAYISFVSLQTVASGTYQQSCFTYKLNYDIIMIDSVAKYIVLIGRRVPSTFIY